MLAAKKRDAFAAYQVYSQLYKYLGDSEREAPAGLNFNLVSDKIQLA